MLAIMRSDKRILLVFPAVAKATANLIYLQYLELEKGFLGIVPVTADAPSFDFDARLAPLVVSDT